VPCVSLPSPREPRGALMPCAVLCGFMREQPRRKPLHHCFVFNSAVWTLKPHCFRPDARQRRVVNVKVQINRLSGLRAPTNEIAHRVPPISKRASAPSSPAACWFGARGSNQSARPSDAHDKATVSLWGTSKQTIRPAMWRHIKMLRVLQLHHSCAPMLAAWHDLERVRVRDRKRLLRKLVDLGRALPLTRRVHLPNRCSDRALRAINSPARLAYSVEHGAGLSCSGANVAV
jgi:hypothetical protein